MLEKQNDSNSEMLTALARSPNVTAMGKYPIKTGNPEYIPSLISALVNIAHSLNYNLLTSEKLSVE